MNSAMTDVASAERVASQPIRRKKAPGGRAAVTPTRRPTPIALDLPLRWRPQTVGNGVVGPEIVVAQGDLTTSTTDAIVNPANSYLCHGGGVAGAISSKGGCEIDNESKAWIRQHRKLPEGHAMVTCSGKLPCGYVVHTVGPRVNGRPTPAQAQLLRSAVYSALCEADKLKLTSIAIPGISSGIFGYPRDLAAKEIVGECVRYACEQARATTLQSIVLMNIDAPTCRSFVHALTEVMELSARNSVKNEQLQKPIEGEIKGAAMLTTDSKQPVAPINAPHPLLTDVEKFVCTAQSLATVASVVCGRGSKQHLRVARWYALAGVCGAVGGQMLELLVTYQAKDIAMILHCLAYRDADRPIGRLGGCGRVGGPRYKPFYVSKTPVNC